MRCKFSPFFNDVDPIKIVDIFRKMSFDCSPPMREEFIRKRYFWRFCPRIAILCVQYVKNPMVETGVFIDFWWILQIQMLVIFLKFQEFWCSLFLSRKYKCVHFCRICHDIAIFFFNLRYHTFWTDISDFNGVDIIEKWARICISLTRACTNGNLMKLRICSVASIFSYGL